MACSNCNQNTPLSVYDVQYLYANNCDDCTDGCASAESIKYEGAALTCSEIDTGDNLETILQKIDEKLCSVSGEYSVYNFNCLDDEGSITTEAQFVEAITEYVCTLRTEFDEFVESYDTDITVTLSGLENPNITCASAGVTTADNLQTVLNKYCTKFSQIDTALTISSVDWDQCLSVSTAPTTLTQAFDLVIDQICAVKDIADGGATLPTFNNTTSCLPTPGASDTLEETIEKIKDRLCETPTLNNDNLSSDCVDIPATDTDLETLLQNILDKVDSISKEVPTFDSGDFVVSATDSGDACAGKTIALATPIAQDRLVASNASDASPGTLIQKLEAGTNVSLDDTTTPGKIIINSTITDTNDKVKAFAADANPSNYLSDKIEGSTGDGITITTTSNLTSNKVTINPTIDWASFIPAFVEALRDDTALFNEFCGLISECPCTCGTDECTYYLIVNGSADEADGITYTDCVSNEQFTIKLLPSSSIEICARTSSISSEFGLSEISSIASCAGGTTTSTTTTTTTTAAP